MMVYLHHLERRIIYDRTATRNISSTERSNIRMLKLNPEHKPRDGRKQFITMAKNKGVDEFAIKRIVGHAIQDITENVYTVRDVEWLKQEIEKV